jgi:hypothetical protein
MQIIMRECGGERREWEHTCQAETKQEGLAQAIHKHWGERAMWHSNPGLGWDYGVVTEPSHGAESVISPDLSVQVFDDDGADITKVIE